MWVSNLRFLPPLLPSWRFCVKTVPAMMLISKSVMFAFGKASLMNSKVRISNLPISSSIIFSSRASRRIKEVAILVLTPSAVGAGDGAPDGMPVGTPVGLELGSPVVGVADGAAVGVTDGDGEGSADGDIVGELEGL
jgi:hypothetical protein